MNVELFVDFIFNFRNFGLLSFGAEAEEDEEQTEKFVQKNSGKAKSLHDVVDDPKLSKETPKLSLDIDGPIEEYDVKASTDEIDAEEKANRIREKLKGSKLKESKKSEVEGETSKVMPKESEAAEASDSEPDDYLNELEREKAEKRKKEA